MEVKKNKVTNFGYFCLQHVHYLNQMSNRTKPSIKTYRFEFHTDPLRCSTFEHCMMSRVGGLAEDLSHPVPCRCGAAETIQICGNIRDRNGASKV